MRWALDILCSQPTRFDYVEDVHAPALQALYTTELDPTCSAVPIVQLVDSSGEVSVIKDSTAILKRVAPFLYPPDQTAEIDEWETVRGWHGDESGSAGGSLRLPERRRRLMLDWDPRSARMRTSTFSPTRPGPCSSN